MENSSKATFKAAIDFRPQRSQVFVVLLALVSAMCMGTGFLFLALELSHPEVPLVFGGIVFCASLLAWFKSQVAVDLEGASPTSIHHTTVGTSISTDARTIESTNGRDVVLKILQTVAHRKPLPTPDGLVDQVGRPDNTGLDEASRRVTDANRKMQDLNAEAVRIFGPRLNPVQEGNALPTVQPEGTVPALNSIPDR